MIFLSDIQNTIRKEKDDSLYDTVVLRIEYDVEQSVDTLIDSITGRKVGNYYEFYGVEEIVRAFMQKEGLGYLRIRLGYTLYDEGQSSAQQPIAVEVLYNEPLIKASTSQTAAQLTAARFLNIGSAAWMYPDDSMKVYYWWQSLSESGSIYKTKLDGEEVSEASFHPDEQDSDQKIQSVGPYWRNDRLRTRCVMGNREFCIYYLDAPEVAHFRFRNMYNLEECASVPAAVSSDPKTEFEEAQQDKVLQRYDIEHVTEFTVKTGPLPSFMYRKLLAMCRSRNVYYREMVGSPAVATWRSVIITEYKFGNSNEPNNPITLELKFKYSDITLNEAIEVY